MALQDINLIPESAMVSHAKIGTRTLYIVSAVVLGIFLAVLVVLFTLFSLSVKSLRDVRLSETPVENSLQALAEREYYVRAIAGKVGALQNIQATQPPFESIVSRLIDLQGNNVTYTEVELSAPNSILVSATATNLDAVDGYLADLTQKEFGDQVFSSTVLQSLSRDNTGVYEFTLHFLYTGGNK